jgi:WD40 repeat protein
VTDVPAESAATAQAVAGAADEPPTEPGRLDAFVSYARRDGQIEFVDRLAADLEQRGKTVWVDRKRIEAAAEWQARIARGIAAAKAFIFVLSPESAASSECMKELDVAVEAHKRIIPIVYGDVDPARLPEALVRPNWIFFRAGDDASDALDKTVEALEGDLEWRDLHTRLGVRCSEWQASGSDPSFLLRGIDLEQAEEWLAERGEHREQPTGSQAEYIATSRRAAVTRQRRLFTGVTIALVVSLVLGVLAVIKSVQATDDARRATQEARNAESVAVASTSLNLLASNPWLASQLGVEAKIIQDTPQAENTLATVTAHQFSTSVDFPAEDGVHAIAMSPDSRTLAVADADGAVTSYGLHGQLAAGYGSPVLDDTLHVASSVAGSVNDLVFSPNDRSLATCDQDGRFLMIDRATGSETLVFHSPYGGENSYMCSVGFNPNGRLLAFSDPSGVFLDEVATGAVTRLADLGGSGRGLVAFSPDGRIVAYANGSSQVVLDDITTGRRTVVPVAFLRNTLSGTSSIAFSRDGGELGVGNFDGTVELDHLATGRLSSVNEGGGVTSVAFGPDGSVLASGNSDGQVVLYRIRTGQLSRFDDGDSVGPLTFSPDGASLAAAGLTSSGAGMVAVYSDPVWSAGLTLVRADLCDWGEGDGATGSAPEEGMTRVEWSAYVPNLPYNPPCASVKPFVFALPRNIW